MSDAGNLKIAKKMVEKYWRRILIIGIFFSIIFCGYKEYTGKYVIQSGDVLIGRQIQLVNYADRQDRIKFDQLVSSDTILYEFYIQNKDSFKYDKINPGWNTKSDFQKIEWMKKHIIVKDYGAGNLEFRFDFMKSEPKNLTYLKENGGKYIDNYLEFLEEKNVISKYVIKEQMDVFPQSEVIDKRGVLFKYGIIGFILGTILSSTLFFIREIYK